MKKLFNIKLDTTSDYMMDDKLWPKACCDVMVEPDDRMIDMAKILFGKEDGDGYVDAYAIIDPERKLVTEFLIIYKDLDGSEDSINIKVSDVADSVEYYLTLKDQGGTEFVNFIAESNIRIHSLRCEQSGSLVDVVDDFLEDRDVRIPTSVQEMKNDGEWNENSENNVRIYGSDYDDLVAGFESCLEYGLDNSMKDSIKAFYEWQKKYLPDEDYFYNMLFEAGFTGRQIEDAVGEDAAVSTKKYWEEHGFI